MSESHAYATIAMREYSQDYELWVAMTYAAVHGVHYYQRTEIAQCSNLVVVKVELNKVWQGVDRRERLQLIT